MVCYEILMVYYDISILCYMYAIVYVVKYMIKMNVRHQYTLHVVLIVADLVLVKHAKIRFKKCHRMHNFL